MDYNSRIDAPTSRAARNQLLRFCGLLAVLWLLLAGLHSAFPYLKPGAELVFGAKVDAARSVPVFAKAPPGAARVAVFGSSKVLSGFRPDLFDRLSGGRAYSWNFGLPATGDFVGVLESLCAQGQVPTHVVLTIPWADSDASKAMLFDDTRMRDALAPFHSLPRDVLLLLTRSAGRGGPSALYRRSRETVESMLEQRGYYFIEGQSRFPGHALPDDFRTGSETPEKVVVRAIPATGPLLERVRDVAQRHGFRVYFVPTYARAGEWAPGPARPPEEPQRFVKVLGPDYVLYPPRYFSDALHLNPAGAEAYTKDLWELLKAEFP